MVADKPLMFALISGGDSWEGHEQCEFARNKLITHLIPFFHPRVHVLYLDLGDMISPQKPIHDASYKTPIVISELYMGVIICYQPKQCTIIQKYQND